MSRDIHSEVWSGTDGYGVIETATDWGRSVRGSVRTVHGIAHVSWGRYDKTGNTWGHVEFITGGWRHFMRFHGKTEYTRVGLVRIAARFVRDVMAQGGGQ